MNKTLTSSDRDVLAITRSASLFRRHRRAPLVGTLARATKAVYRSMKRLHADVSEGLRMSRLYEDLSRMSDRELAEVGITRAEIAAVVAGTLRIPGKGRSHGRSAGD